ncbi:type II toxin-antitoxin system RelE/ParE family toxin [Leptospira levettii]|uniref:Type II toxin-antitoxin system RelE/ParE family toxin n=1 Tax=Leptospira levettii TaxID=2023178 RepID=A0AAW5V6C5_9LEPT|nr:type II toxin-antitoxin system RelE/ParE family toxin [Leptospira levettii]MCW7467865.1 type II toxin-antitoxin system RelE/ParE family toxin [Leptospira levettii]MCW7513433.1 type II toxin-antitoxin system RelE/ParE family toxin [Leptospira levettii]MCW7517181.1 type II toxin-antitoxin system RelE/ParE family toxin [Leptospira levettii]
MIIGFADKKTEKVWKGEFSKNLPTEVQNQGRKKLRMINNAHNIEDLKVPPGNKLEILKGDRKGQHSIRINDQWRICFIWDGNNASLVEIVDYH